MAQKARFLTFPFRSHALSPSFGSTSCSTFSFALSTFFCAVCLFIAIASCFRFKRAVTTPAKNATLFEPFIYKNDQFTKTGSGQT